MIDRKHRGARSELIASTYLLDQGYEVFRNVSSHAGRNASGKINGTGAGRDQDRFGYRDKERAAPEEPEAALFRAR